MQTPSRGQAIQAAAAAIGQAYALLDELPVAEAARVAYTPTGPPLAELEARIRARRNHTTTSGEAA